MTDPERQPDPITVTGATGAPESTRTLAADLLAESAKRLEGATGATVGAGPPPPQRPPPSELLGYRLGRPLGAGGMGLVFEAVHARLKRTVALKLLKPEVASRRDFADRFLRESKAMAAVSHENVVGIFDAGEHDGYLYMALEFLPGGDLARLVRRRGPLEPKDAIAIALGCARGLGAIHAAGLIHRDIKPQNVFLDRDLRPKIGDLGLARESDGGDRMTMTGAAWGTPSFMSPEQVRGVADIDARTDIYSLGALLFTILTGTEPFDGATAYIVTHKVLTEPPPDPRAHNHLVPAALAAITLKAMAKDRAERYRSCADLALDLERARDGKPLLHAATAAIAAGPPAAAPAHAAAPMRMPTRDAGAWPTLPAGAAKAIAMLVVAGVLYAVYCSLKGQTSIDPPARVHGGAEDTPSWAASAGQDSSGRWADLSLGPTVTRFRWCPPGAFTMGSPEDEPGRAASETRHQVVITHGYWISATECTHGLWREVLPQDTGAESLDPMMPESDINREDCLAFLAALGKRCGALARLPTEAEWERACRAGGDGPFAGAGIEGLGRSASGQLLAAWRAHADDPTVENEVARLAADLRDDPEIAPHPVGRLRANAWGIFDMHGGQAEWCADWWDGQSPLPATTETDPLGDSGGLGVCRGGSWWVPPERCRSAARAGLRPTTRAAWLGLRIVIADSAGGAAPTSAH